jgi:hypothetical protein
MIPQAASAARQKPDGRGRIRQWCDALFPSTNDRLSPRDMGGEQVEYYQGARACLFRGLGLALGAELTLVAL